MLQADIFRPHQQHDIPRRRIVPGGPVKPGLRAVHKDGVAFKVRVDDIDIADKACDEFVGRLLIDIARSADLLHAALVDDDDLVGNLHGFVLVMGDENARHIELVMHVAQPPHEAFAHLQVKGCKRLVQQQYGGLGRKGAGKGNALALAARKLRGVVPGIAAHLYKIDEVADPVGNLLFAFLLHVQGRRLYSARRSYA